MRLRRKGLCANLRRVVAEGTSWPRPGSSPRSLRPMWSDTAGLLAPTRNARWRGCARCAAICSIRPSPCTRAGRQAHRRRRRWSSSAAWSTPCAAPSRCRTAWSSATPALPPERRIEFRIGVHLGDVVEESDGDLMGDGVNIAARLEGVAEPGGDLSFRCRLRTGARQAEREFADLGETSLKNIARPVRVYRVRPESGSRTFRAGAPRQAVDRRAAFHEYERRPRAGIFFRRHQRGHHHRALQAALVLRHRPQLVVHLQGQGRPHEAGRRRARRRLCARGQRAQGRRPCAHHGAAQRCRDRQPHLGGALRPRPGRRIRGAGRDHRSDRRRDRAAALCRRNFRAQRKPPDSWTPGTW